MFNRIENLIDSVLITRTNGFTDLLLLFDYFCLFNCHLHLIQSKL